MSIVGVYCLVVCCDVCILWFLWIFVGVSAVNSGWDVVMFCLYFCTVVLFDVMWYQSFVSIGSARVCILLKMTSYIFSFGHVWNFWRCFACALNCLYFVKPLENASFLLKCNLIMNLIHCYVSKVAHMVRNDVLNNFNFDKISCFCDVSAQRSLFKGGYDIIINIHSRHIEFRRVFRTSSSDI